MFSTLLIVIALTGNEFISADAEPLRGQIGQNSDGSNRQSRQIWFSPSPYHASSFFYHRYWLAQLAYYSEWIRKHQSLITGYYLNFYTIISL